MELEKLKSYGKPSGIANPIAKIGLPFGLNNFELLPFWTAFLRKLGFETVLSDVSTAICTCRVSIPSRPTRFAIRQS